MPQEQREITIRMEAHVGCFSRIIVILSILVQVVAGGLALIVLGSAGVLGEAAIISADDALIVFVAICASLLATIVLSVKIWLSSRDRKRLRAMQIGSRTNPEY